MRLDEFLARRLAARKMRLIKDRHGSRLSDELWLKAMPEAEFIIEAMQNYELLEIVRRHYEAEDGE